MIEYTEPGVQMNTKPNVDFSRRQFLKTSSAATLMIMGGAVINQNEAWGLETKALKPETMQTLIQMARDIFPHDRFADKIYALAVKTYDESAVEDEELKTMVEDGVNELNTSANDSFGFNYVDVGWEDDRNSLLTQAESGPLFQKLRGDLVVSIYNNQDVWAILGYEGESFSKGGYIERGFNDLEWL